MLDHCWYSGSRGLGSVVLVTTAVAQTATKSLKNLE